MKNKRKCFICGRSRVHLYSWSLDDFFGMWYTHNQKELLCDDCWKKIESLLNNTICPDFFKDICKFKLNFWDGNKRERMKKKEKKLNPKLRLERFIGEKI